MWGSNRQTSVRNRFSRHKLDLLVVALGCGLIGLGLLSSGRAQPSPEAGRSPAVVAETDPEKLAAEQIIVRYKPNADMQRLLEQYSQLGARQRDQLQHLRMIILQVPPQARDSIITALRANPLLELVEADSVQSTHVTTPNDTEYATQWVWPKTQTNVAWDRTKGSAAITVAVLDSGINFNHPEFSGKTVAGYDFVNNDTSPQDDWRHGSAVAGVIAARTNNGLGVASGCWECKIMPVKVMNNEGKGSVSNIVKGMEYAADKGAKIVNMSIGGDGDSSAQAAAVDYVTSKGAIVVASAGNNSSDTPQRPARYDKTIAVAATDQNDKLTSYSNFGSHVDVAAPGQARTIAHNSDGYITIAGTSFSAPTVASILALMWSVKPAATPTELREALLSTADVCCDGKIGGGRVNAAKAVQKLVASTPPPDPQTADLTGDGKINISDLSQLMSAWGRTNHPADFNKNGAVDIGDLSVLLSGWTG